MIATAHSSYPLNNVDRLVLIVHHHSLTCLPFLSKLTKQKELVMLLRNHKAQTPPSPRLSQETWMKGWGEENAPHQWLHKHIFHCNIVTSKAVETYLKKKKNVIKLSRSLSEPVQPCVTSELSPIRKDDRHSEAVQQSLPHSFHFFKHVHIQQPGLVWALSQNLGGERVIVWNVTELLTAVPGTFSFTPEARVYSDLREQRQLFLHTHARVWNHQKTHPSSSITQTQPSKGQQPTFRKWNAHRDAEFSRNWGENIKSSTWTGSSLSVYR